MQAVSAKAAATDPPEESRAAPGALSALRDTLVLLALTGGVWLVHLFGRTLPTAALAAAWGLLAIVIAAGLFRRARIRRGAFLAAYLRAASPFVRLLRGGWLMAARWLLVAAALSLVLMVALIRLDDPREWIVLIASAPILVAAHRLVRRVLAKHVRADYLPELVWRITSVGVGVLMVGVLAALAFYRPYPDLGGVSLERAVWHYVNEEHARSAPAEMLLEAAAAKDALRFWLAQQLMPQPGDSLAQALGWLAVLAEESLFVWSYLMFAGAALLRSAGLGGDNEGGGREGEHRTDDNFGNGGDPGSGPNT
jgi:hypothetical protein